MTPPEAPRAKPRRRGAKIALAIFTIVVVALAGLVWFALSDRGLSYIASRVAARSGGQVTVENPSGSIANSMRFGRVTWRGADVTLVADDVVVDWKPGALLGRHLLIRGLGARKVQLSLKPSTGPTKPPTDLTLPLAIDIDRLAIGEFDWQAGPRTGRITGLELGYSGGKTGHQIRDLSLVSDYGKLTGNLTVGARDPLPVQGSVTLDGAGPIEGAHADVTLAGPLARLDVAAKGAYREASLAITAVATPFGSTPFASATADIALLDASTFDPALPKTRARVHLAFAPQGGGIAGTFDAVNMDPGPIDRERLPFARFAAKFALAPPELRLDDVVAAIADGGTARGSGVVTLTGASRGVRFRLDVADFDLSKLDTKLVATRMSGRLAGDANQARQTIEGDVRERDTMLAFAATIDDARIDVREFRASRGGGSLAGRATLLRNDANDFTLQARVQNLDPSRFGSLPSASLDGTVEAKGVLHPQLRVTAAADLAPSSRYENVAVAGTVKGMFTRSTASDLTVDVTLASAHVKASGAVGAPNNRLAIDIDAPDLATVAPLLPASLPHPLAGSLRANAHLALAPGVVGGDVSWHAQALRAGDYRAATLEGRASVAAGGTTRASLASRTLTFDVKATTLASGTRELDAVHVAASGTLAHHHVTLDARNGAIDLSVAVDGALRNVDDLEHAQWNATVASFENRGSVPVRIAAGANIVARAGYAQITNAQLDVAEGRASVGELTWNHGRITTRGSFTGVPLATAARLAGRKLPLDATLVLGGEWSIAADPRLNGTFSVKRERGDVIADIPGVDGTRREGMGIETLLLAGTFRNDTLDARASFVSSRAGSVSGTATIGAVAGAPAGIIDPKAPLRLAVQGTLASLAVFQPWFGTEFAVDGRANLDVAATGTVGAPLWTGALEGTALRINAPKYGVHVTNGTLRAHVARNGIVLDALHFAGGDGTLDVSGLFALPGARSGATTQLTWNAAHFRVANRPDLRFVVDGSGTVAFENARLALQGQITVVEGHVEYEPSPTGQLASDIVIEGRPRKVETTTAARSPLALDVIIDLGNRLSFTGEGLDARLAGRIHVTTNASGRVQASGTIRAVNGTYYAFGQKLTIDRGRVIFDGPIDNPALDVIALRKNLPVEAGVAISGTVKVPQVRVTSNPPVPENEALAWLVTGQGLNTSGRIDYGALSAASAALLGRGGKPFTAEIAQRFGLDEISLQSSGTSASTGTQSTLNQVVVFGKRISDRLTLGYEQGLSLASSALRLEYALTNRVTIRAEAGTTSGVSIVYRRSFR
jgi:translocation and assembly module TamB